MSMGRKKNLVQMRDFRMVALALIFTVAMELDMANHQAGQGQGSKGEPLAFLCAQLQPPGMPRLFLWPWWTHNCKEAHGRMRIPDLN